MRHLNVTRSLSIFVVMYLACVIAAVSCSGSQRMKTVAVAVLSVDTARDGFMVWTKDHQKAIIDKATSKQEAEAGLTAYIVERDKIKEGFEIVYRALALASTKTDDSSLQEALTAAAALYTRIKTFTESFKPPPAATPPPASASADGGL